MNSFARQILCSVMCLVFVLVCGQAAHGAKGSSKQAQSSSSPTGEPFIEMPQLSYNFGEVLEGTEIEHDFPVKNKGMEVLHIDRVKTG
ncbi:MAG: hypothetical protein ABFD97_07505 [Syntrophobacter sp.]